MAVSSTVIPIAVKRRYSGYQHLEEKGILTIRESGYTYDLEGESILAHLCGIVVKVDKAGSSVVTHTQ